MTEQKEHVWVDRWCEQGAWCGYRQRSAGLRGPRDSADHAPAEERAYCHQRTLLAGLSGGVLSLSQSRAGPQKDRRFQ